MSGDRKTLILIGIIILILLIIPFSFLGYGIWAVIHSKKISNKKKSDAFLSIGIISIIIGLLILIIESHTTYVFFNVNAPK
jgi:hypothetical protein